MADRTKIPKYKLIYFPVRGRAEFIRYLFALADVPYEEEFIESKDWPHRKLDMPFKSLPLLDINDGEHVLNQSLAIARLLAKRFGMAGKNPYEQALADHYVDGWQDIYTHYFNVVKNIFVGNLEAAKEAYIDFKRDALESYLKRYESFLNSNPRSSGWLVGDRVTWADLVIGEFIDRMRYVYDPNLLDNYPNLDRLVNRLNELPPIKRRIEIGKRRPDWSNHA